VVKCAYFPSNSSADFSDPGIAQCSVCDPLKPRLSPSIFPIARVSDCCTGSRKGNCPV